MNDKKEAHGPQAVREESPQAAAFFAPTSWMFVVVAFAAVGNFGIAWQFSLDRNPDMVRPALELPAAKMKYPETYTPITLLATYDPNSSILMVR